jgi:hypothetical protein
MTRRMRRLAVRGHDKCLLQLRGATVDNARADDRMALELDGKGFQEGVPLQGVDGRSGGLDSGEFVI